MANLVEKIRRHGLANTVLAVALKALNSLCAVKVLRGVYVERPHSGFLQYPERYTAGFLSAAQLRRYSADERTELSRAFLDGALGKGDECYAIRDGEELAAYGWYAACATPIGLGDLALRFDADYIYMYKGFTDPRYRGQRLHAIGMTRALEHFMARGCKGIVSYVEATNFDSLKSCFRMGYRVFGSVYIVRLFGRHYAVSSPGCRRFGFRLERRSAPQAALNFGKG